MPRRRRRRRECGGCLRRRDLPHPPRIHQPSCTSRLRAGGADGRMGSPATARMRWGGPGVRSGSTSGRPMERSCTDPTANDTGNGESGAMVEPGERFPYVGTCDLADFAAMTGLTSTVFSVSEGATVENSEGVLTNATQSLETQRPQDRLRTTRAYHVTSGAFLCRRPLALELTTCCTQRAGGHAGLVGGGSTRSEHLLSTSLLARQEGRHRDNNQEHQDSAACTDGCRSIRWRPFVIRLL
jgi:hypothetical protein